MCSKEAGAAATMAAVTASDERGSDWMAAQPPGSSWQAAPPPGSDWQAAQPPRVASDAEILEFLTGVMRGDGEGSTQTMKAAELLGKRIGLFSERAEPPPAPVIIDDVAALATSGAEEGKSG